MATTPLVAGLRALGPEGPFPAGSQARWSQHRDGLVREFDPAAYGAALVATGAPGAEVDRVIAKLEHAGARRVLWACGHGGAARGGQVSAIWDVRVVATDEPAAAVAADIGASEELPSDGVRTIDGLSEHPGVLDAHVRPFPPSTVPIAREELPWWGRLARLKLEVRYDHEWMANATLGVGCVGADVLTTSRSPLAAEEALGRLVAVVLADLEAHAAAPA